MKIIPAVDLLDGRCVRLHKGNYDQVTVYYENPAEAAAYFQSIGIPRLHVVDLDAARGRGKNNREALRKIAAVFDGEIEVGGGVRCENDIEELLKAGAGFLIAGTVLAKEPETVGRWVSRYGARFIAGIDALNATVRVSGWEKDGGVSDEALAKTAAEIGCSAVIYTNIDKDGRTRHRKHETDCGRLRSAGDSFGGRFLHRRFVPHCRKRRYRRRHCRKGVL